MEGQERTAVIEALIADFQEREIPRVTPRSLSLPSLPGKADVVVGMRRSGKTWFLYQRIGELPMASSRAAPGRAPGWSTVSNDIWRPEDFRRSRRSPRTSGSACSRSMWTWSSSATSSSATV